MNREQAAVRGGIVGILSQIITLLLKFIIRTYLIRVLGRDFLGLDSVILDLVSMLSLTDLGISAAMLYKLYRPVIQGDFARISELLAAYKFIFRGISIAIACFGIVLSAFLPLIVKNISVPWIVIYVAFYLQLTATVLTYFVSEKRILLDADKHRHLSMICDLLVYVITAVLEIISLIVFKNYLWYLAFAITQPILGNILITTIFNKRYKSRLNSVKFRREDIKGLYQDAKQVFGNKIAGYIYSSTDNIVISVFLGTSVVGLLSNYRYITNALKSLLNSAMSAMQPLVGNFLNSETSKERAFLILERYTFLRFFIVGGCVVPVIVVANTFIEIWTGSQNYVLSIAVPALMMFDFYCGAMSGPLGEYLIGLGKFVISRKIAFVNAGINILLSVVSVHFLGYMGVLVGTAVSQIITWILNIRFLFDGFFESKPNFRWKYVRVELLYLVDIVLAVVISHLIVMRFSNVSPWTHFLVGGVVSELIFLMVALGSTFRGESFNYFKSIFRRILKR